MYKVFIAFCLVFLTGCKQKSSDATTNNSNEIKDPHSFSNYSEAVVKHLDLDLTINFDTQQVTGKASWTIANLLKSDKIIFDTRDMQIQKVTVGSDEKQAKHSLGSGKDYLGQALTVNIDSGTSVVNIYYTTSKDAAALQWLTPQQTAGKKRPFFTNSIAANISQNMGSVPGWTGGPLYL